MRRHPISSASTRAAVVLAVGLAGPGLPASAQPDPPRLQTARPREPPAPTEAAPVGWFEQHGISFGLVAKSDTLSKVRGGLSDSVALRYRGYVDFVTQIDTERLGLWSGGRLFFAVQNGHGQGLSHGDVGDVQVLSNIDAHSFTQMSEWWLEQTALEGRVRVKVGRQDAGADFACVDFGGEFLNSSFGLIPTAPVPTFPDPALGVSAFFDLSDEVAVGAGVYAPTPIGWGRLRGATFGVEMTLAPSTTGRPPDSRYRAGFWYHSDPFSREVPGLTSVYIALDRSLYREEDSAQGLRGFFQAGTSSGAPNGVSDYLGAGVVYTGLLPGRDEDAVGLGVAFARLPAGPNPGRTETDIELLYRLSPWRWLTVQPTLHYVLRPGGQPGDALVAGLRIETEF